MIQRDIKKRIFSSRLWLRSLTTLLLLGPWGLLGASPSIGQEAGALSEDSGSIDALHNQVDFSYTSSGSSDESFSQSSNSIDLEINRPLVDPRGQLLGCGGDPLDDYTGFSISLFTPDASDPTESELGSLLDLTRTELPDRPNNNIAGGIEPNTRNVNPFPLSNEDEGRYSFLLDRSRGQLEVGSTYVLVLDPPSASRFTQRRIKIEISNIEAGAVRDFVSYRAVSLDGLPIGVEGEMELSQTVAFIPDADRIGLELLAVQFSNTLCQVNQIQIEKSADRANVAPGDIVIYRLQITNISDESLDQITVSDRLPVGFQLLDASVAGEYDGEEIQINFTRNGRRLTLRTETVLPIDASLRIIYATEVTPDGIRGNGENRASVRAQRVDNDLRVSDGPAIHRVRVGGGITSDCGTIVGRIFEDKNFDGEQQKGEPGIPYAVVFMDDGNRVTADENGLFSVKCVLPGYRSGALDPLSVPGYELAPNVKFIEGNSPSRIVRLAPGGLERMNFAVTPTAERGEEAE